MSKLLDKKASCKYDDYKDDQGNYIICQEAVELMLGESTENQNIRVRIYDKNPKRKNTIHVRVKPKRPVGLNRYVWMNQETFAYSTIEYIVDKAKINEFWLVINRCET